MDISVNLKRRRDSLVEEGDKKKKKTPPKQDSQSQQQPKGGKKMKSPAPLQIIPPPSLSTPRDSILPAWYNNQTEQGRLLTKSDVPKWFFFISARTF